MIRGLMVIRADGFLVYAYPPLQNGSDNQKMAAGLVQALQIFVKEMFQTDASSIRSAILSSTEYTFRTLTLQSHEGQVVEYCFIVLSETGKRREDLAEVLEFLIVSFLGYDSGRFERALRAGAPDTGLFSHFDDFMKDVVASEWRSIRKRVRPAAANLLQGLLNELREYMTVEQMLSLSPRLHRVGPSYVWVSDRLSKDETDSLLETVKQLLTKTYGPGVFESLVEKVKKAIEEN